MGWSFLCRGVVCSQNLSLAHTLHLEYWSSALQCKSRTNWKRAELAETRWVCLHRMVIQSLMELIWFFFPFGLCKWTVWVRMFDSFWFTRLHLFMSLKVQEIRDPYKWTAITHSWRPIRWTKNLPPISVFSKSNIFTLGTSYPWSLHDNGHRRNPKDMKKWIRWDKESFLR